MSTSTNVHRHYSVDFNEKEAAVLEAGLDKYRADNYGLRIKPSEFVRRATLKFAQEIIKTK